MPGPLRIVSFWMLVITLVLIGLALLGRLVPRHDARDYEPVRNRWEVR